MEDSTGPFSPPLFRSDVCVSICVCVAGIQTAVDVSVWEFFVFLQQCQGHSCKFQII